MVGGKRVGKDDPRLEVYGEIDELNSQLGLCRSLLETTNPEGFQDLVHILEHVQAQLFCMGASLATPAEVRDQYPPPRLDPEEVVRLEKGIDRLEEELPVLRNFILPGGHPLAARLHVARAVCRRAERRLAALVKSDGAEHFSLQYLNRLSDYLFTAARSVNVRTGQPEKIWRG
jgi:cob(I)alamin adenosyltransferase